MSKEKINRRQQILQALVYMLEVSPGGRITTAALAKEVGFSEAALYRHFPSKEKMFEGLVEFIETTIFTRIALILKEESAAMLRCQKILHLLLTFCERNPGITRLLTGDAFIGETERLRGRILQFFDRLEMQLRQVLREAELREQWQPTIPISGAANLLLSWVEGRIVQYVRSGFKRPPLEHCSQQWPVLLAGFLSEEILTSSRESAGAVN